jgi:hypothetical protein
VVRHSRQVFCGGGWLLFVDGIDVVAAAHSGLGTDSFVYVSLSCRFGGGRKRRPTSSGLPNDRDHFKNI